MRVSSLLVAPATPDSPPVPALALALMTGLGACQPLAPAGYVGEPLASLYGDAVPFIAEPLPPAEIVIAWARDSGSPGGIRFVGERAMLERQFPSAFRIDLRQKPPPLLDVNGRPLPISIGFVLAFRAGAVVTGATIDVPNDLEAERVPVGPLGHLMGGADVSIAYLHGELDEEHPLSTFFGVSRAGFHLLAEQAATVAQAQRAHASCVAIFGPQSCGDAAVVETVKVPAPEGLATRIRVTLFPPAIDD